MASQYEAQVYRCMDPTLDLLERTENPLHRAILKNYCRHVHLEGASLFDESLKYRIPFQPSIDQNTVDLQQEQSTYTENSMQFQASLTMLNSKFKGLVAALRGE